MELFVRARGIDQDEQAECVPHPWMKRDVFRILGCLLTCKDHETRFSLPNVHVIYLCHLAVRAVLEVVHLTKHCTRTAVGILMDTFVDRNASADSRSSSVSTAPCLGFATELAASHQYEEYCYKACTARPLFPSKTPSCKVSLLKIPLYLVGISYPNLHSDLQYHLSLLQA